MRLDGLKQSKIIREQKKTVKDKYLVVGVEISECNYERALLFCGIKA
jgi:hypothetical protein